MRREDFYGHMTYKTIEVYKKFKACLLKMKFHHYKIFETCTYFYISFNKQVQKTIGYTIARYVLDLVFGKKKYFCEVKGLQALPQKPSLIWSTAMLRKHFKITKTRITKKIIRKEKSLQKRMVTTSLTFTTYSLSSLRLNRCMNLL